MRRRLIAIATLVAGFTTALAVPAFASRATLGDWTSGYCTVIGRIRSGKISSELVDDIVKYGISSRAKAKAARAKIVKDLDAASAERLRVAKEIENLGTPAVADGVKIASSIAKSYREVAKIFHGAGADAAGLPTEPSAFEAAVADLKARVDHQVDENYRRNVPWQASKGYEKIIDEALRTKACEALGS